MGARFAKWRAVIRVTDALPSSACVRANAHALARYAALCQEQEFVPIVEPEVLMDGSHTIERCEEVTGVVLHASSTHSSSRVSRSKGCCSSPTWLSRARSATRQASVEEVATATLALLAPARACRGARNRVPVGRPKRPAGDRASERNQPAAGPKPWKISFSYGRALQDPALEAWHGRDENLRPASKPSTTGPDSTGRRASGSTPMKWRRHRQAPTIRRIAATGATTDKRDPSRRAPAHGHSMSEDQRRQ